MEWNQEKRGAKKMSEFVESKATGKYPSGLPYTSFHKKEQEWDNKIGIYVEDLCY